MNIIYAQESFSQTITKTIYLAGPSPRNIIDTDWRQEALTLLAEKHYDGDVYIPLSKDGKLPENAKDQLDWEQLAMDRSDLILFWVPRDLVKLPGYTTNIEFGEYLKSRKVILGYPLNAPKMRVLDLLAQQYNIPIVHSLSEVIEMAIAMLGSGALREGGETQVPLHLWKLPHFQNWLRAQKEVGNRLDSVFSIDLQFGVGPKKAYLLYWGMHVSMFVAAENRCKTNEIVLSRPDIQHIVAYYVPKNNCLDQIEVVLVREFRSSAATMDGFIHEVPGGSGYKTTDPMSMAAKEFKEETGIVIAPERLLMIGVRQLAGTTTAHKAYAFSLELTELEMNEIKKQQGTCFGNRQETEQTYLEVYTVQDLLANPYTDWSNLGMILTAIYDK